MDARSKIVLLAAVALIAACSTSTQPGSVALDADELFASAERRHPGIIESVAELRQLQDDYTAVTRLSRNGDQRGQAYLRLAEIDSALGDYQTAQQNLERALHAGMEPANQRTALLALGDLLERRFGEVEEAGSAYRQLVAEHPGTDEAELARLRLGGYSR